MFRTTGCSGRPGITLTNMTNIAGEPLSAHTLSTLSIPASTQSEFAVLILLGLHGPSSTSRLCLVPRSQSRTGNGSQKPVYIASPVKWNVMAYVHVDSASKRSDRASAIILLIYVHTVVNAVVAKPVLWIDQLGVSSLTAPVNVSLWTRMQKTIFPKHMSLFQTFLATYATPIRDLVCNI